MDEADEISPLQSEVKGQAWQKLSKHVPIEEQKSDVNFEILEDEDGDAESQQPTYQIRPKLSEKEFKSSKKYIILCTKAACSEFRLGRGFLQCSSLLAKNPNKCERFYYKFNCRPADCRIFRDSTGLSMLEFKPLSAKEIIHNVLYDQLSTRSFSEEYAYQWSKEIADIIKLRMKELKCKEYKFIVNVVMGEQRGAGVKMGTRCIWDAEADSYAYDNFVNDTLFCVATVYAVHYY